MDIKISPAMRENLVALEVELKVYGKPPAPVRMGKGGGGPGRKRRIGDEFIRYLYSRMIESSTGCWEWQGHHWRKGYGVVRFYNKQLGVTKAMYWIHRGPMEPKMFVCHKCNNPRCARHDHLYAATNSQNMRDAYRDGLIPLGEQHHKSKLTDKDVLYLRERAASGVPIRQLIIEYGIYGVYKAVRGESWKHLPMPPALAQRYQSKL